MTPILTERSHTIAENRVERLERVVVAAVKQCNHFLLLLQDCSYYVILYIFTCQLSALIS